MFIQLLCPAVGVNVIAQVVSEGYGGNIVLYVGIRLDGTVNDISILSISETPGLGMKAGDVLVPQFHNKNVKSFAYTKTGSTSDRDGYAQAQAELPALREWLGVG